MAFLLGFDGTFENLPGGPSEGDRCVSFNCDFVRKLKLPGHEWLQRGLQGKFLRHCSSKLPCSTFRGSRPRTRSQRRACRRMCANLRDELRHWPRFHQRSANRITEEVVYHTLLAKSYLGLR